MIASWFGCGRRPDKHNGKSDGYAAASVRSTAAPQANTGHLLTIKVGEELPEQAQWHPLATAQPKELTALERPQAPSLPPRENVQVQGTHTRRTHPQAALLFAEALPLPTCACRSQISPGRVRHRDARACAQLSAIL